MEEYAPVLWMVVLLGFLLLSSFSKLRKKAENAAKRFEEHLPREAWPTWDTTEERAQRTVEDEEGPAMEQWASTQEAIPAPCETPWQSPQAAEEPYAEGEEAAAISGFSAPRDRTARLHSQESASVRNERSGRSSAAMQPDSASEADEKGTTEEEFDLRGAIIYSEILKPKFDE